MAMNQQEYYTAEEVADLLKVSKQAVYKWVTEGRVESVRIGRTVRIPGYALQQLIEESREPARGAPKKAMAQAVGSWC